MTKSTLINIWPSRPRSCFMFKGFWHIFCLIFVTKLRLKALTDNLHYIFNLGNYGTEWKFVIIEFVHLQHSLWRGFYFVVIGLQMKIEVFSEMYLHLRDYNCVECYESLSLLYQWIFYVEFWSMRLEYTSKTVSPISTF